MTQTKEPKLDAEQLQDIKDIMGKDFPTFVMETLENMANHIKNLQTGIEQKNKEEIKHAAHPLSSNGGYLGAVGVQEAAEKIEDMADEQIEENRTDIPAIIPFVQQLQDEFDMIRPILQKEAGDFSA